MHVQKHDSSYTQSNMRYFSDWSILTGLFLDLVLILVSVLFLILDLILFLSCSCFLITAALINPLVNQKERKYFQI